MDTRKYLLDAAQTCVIVTTHREFIYDARSVPHFFGFSPSLYSLFASLGHCPFSIVIPVLPF